MQRRSTVQRKIIYDILLNTRSHPTADWIYDEVKKYIPNISLGTVYRNLRVLRDEGLIMEISDGKQSRFDARTDNHFHFKCDLCGAIYDIELQDVNISIDTKKLIEKGFKVSVYNVDFFGICRKCNKEFSVEKDS